VHLRCKRTSYWYTGGDGDLTRVLQTLVPFVTAASSVISWLNILVPAYAGCPENWPLKRALFID